MARNSPKNIMFFQVVVISILCAFLFSLDGSIVNIALPEMARAYNASVSDIAFIPTAYMITVSSTLLLVSVLFNRFGMKRVITAGYVIFIISTLLCALAPQLWLMIVLRVLQGLGGSMLLMAAFTVVPRYIEPAKMGRALGFSSSALACGIAAGYPAGGFITDFFGWNYVFVFVAFMTIPALIYIKQVLPEDEPVAAGAGIDVSGAVIFLIAFAMFTYVLQYVEYTGLSHMKVLFCILGFLLMSVLFIVHEKRKENAIVDLSLFRFREYGFAMLSRLFVAMLQYGNLFMLPFFLGIIRKMSPSKSGLLIAVYSVFYIFLAPVSGYFTDSFSPQKMSVFSTLILLFVSFLFLFIMGVSGFVPIVIYLVFLSIGFAFFYPANNKFCILAVPVNRQGMSIGIFLTVWVAGMSLGTSFFEMVFSVTLMGEEQGLSSLKDLVKGISSERLFDAFRNSYTAGFIIILTALVFLVISLIKQKKREPV
jgi:EmrB/QacA subfamily drug resistance transporter